MSIKGSMWKVVLAGVIAMLALAGVAVAAVITQKYTQKFTTNHPGQASGMTFQAGGSPQAKSVTLTFPAGTVINTKAVAACGKTAKTCSVASKVGSGTAVVRLGTTSLATNVTAYNRVGGMTIIVTSPVKPDVVLRPTLTKGVLQIPIPSLVIAGSKITLTSLTLKVNKIGSGSRAYLRTPPTCPKSKVWAFTGRFTYPGGAVKTLKSASPCVTR